MGLRPPEERPFEELRSEVCAKYAVTPGQLNSHRRPLLFVMARQELYWKAHQESALSLPAIGRLVGGRDHTTILHGIRKHQERMEAGNGCE